MNNLKPIGVFDSGVGGLSILKELQGLLPHENYIFFADQKNVPYGEKTKEELIALAKRIGQFLMSQNVKMIVAACNTSTCYTIQELRFSFPLLPIIGVVPAIKQAAEKTKTGKIGLVATPATVKSPYVTELVNKFAKNIDVLKIGCAGLENAIEQGVFDSEPMHKLLNLYVLPLKQAGIDQLVLGCTHYPFIKEKISALLGPGVQLVDSGKAVARRVEFILNESNLNNDGPKGKDLFFTNKDAANFSRVASQLLDCQVDAQYTPL